MKNNLFSIIFKIFTLSLFLFFSQLSFGQQNCSGVLGGVTYTASITTTSNSMSVTINQATGFKVKTADGSNLVYDSYGATHNVVGLSDGATYKVYVAYDEASGGCNITIDDGGGSSPNEGNGGNSCQQWTGDCNTSGGITRTGKVTVSRLDVTDIIHSKKVYVHLPSEFPDYVFEKNYDLMPLNQLESYIQKNKHLPNIPSAKVVAEKGIDVANLEAKQMEKIEELTLYIIELSKKIEYLEKENKKIQKKRFFKKRK